MLEIPLEKLRVFKSRKLLSYSNRYVCVMFITQPRVAFNRNIQITIDVEHEVMPKYSINVEHEVIPNCLMNTQWILCNPFPEFVKVETI